MKQHISEGTHILADIHNVSNTILNDGYFLESIMLKACELSGATILGVTRHEFEPAGVTIVVILSESHASIHTYVDHASIHTYVDLENKNNFGMCMCDFFSCGKSKPEIGIKYLIDKLCSEESIVSMKVFKRGLDSGIEEIRDK